MSCGLKENRIRIPFWAHTNRMVTVLAAFQAIDDVMQLMMPGVTMLDILNGLITFCEKRNCFAIIDTPADVKTVMDLLEYRSHFSSSTMYHPWLLLFDRKLKKTCCMPPSEGYRRYVCTYG